MTDPVQTPAENTQAPAETTAETPQVAQTPVETPVIATTDIPALTTTDTTVLATAQIAALNTVAEPIAQPIAIVTATAVPEFHPAVSLLGELEAHATRLSLYGDAEQAIRDVITKLKALF